MKVRVTIDIPITPLQFRALRAKSYSMRDKPFRLVLEDFLLDWAQCGLDYTVDEMSCKSVFVSFGEILGLDSAEAKRLYETP